MNKKTEDVTERLISIMDELYNADAIIGTLQAGAQVAAEAGRETIGYVPNELERTLTIIQKILADANCALDSVQGDLRREA
jgi:hypothetical protein